jgi:hypothetical protein
MQFFGNEHIATPHDGFLFFTVQEFITRRGLNLFTCRWLPADQDIKALVFLCHGNMI